MSIWAWLHRQQLATEIWEPVTIDHVHLAFFRSEFAKLPGRIVGDEDLAQHPDVSDPIQNRRRQTLLYGWRKPLLERIPASTTWYEVRYLCEGHLHQLRIIDFPDWNSPQDRNELLKVAGRKTIAMKDDPSQWSAPILWGHTRKGPFTIIEGNNRLIAYASLTRRPPLRIATYVGLSADPCCWHHPDR